MAQATIGAPVAASPASFAPELNVVDGEITTTSNQVAEHFGKQHKLVLRAIRNLLKELPDGYERNFAPIQIDVDLGMGRTRQDPAYSINRDGFTLLAMGFTGKEALQWKLAYINAFNKMEAELLAQSGAAPYTTSPKAPQALSSDVEALEVAARMLKISESGKLGMVRYAFQQKAPHLLGALPVYAVDAPDGAKVAGSSEPTFSATHLLKERNAPITTAKFNALLADKGIIEKRSRPSSSGVNKDFWVVTDHYFGKNLTSPGNPRETQPHWYESRFDELLSTVRV